MKNFLIVLLALAAYAAILFLPIPASIGLFVRYDLLFLSILALPILFVAFRLRGSVGFLLALGSTLILFALPVSGLWHSGASEPFIIGGLLPFSDAASYYSDAQRLVEGYRFSAFSARRPLFPALLSVLLALTGQNLMLTIAILCLLAGISCYLATREVQRSFGALSGAIFLFILFLFYRRISGTTMTENLGFPLGISAFVILWSSAQQKNLWKTFTGILLISLALNARAGTFFILPALVLWAGFAFRGQKKFSIKASLMVTIAIVLGFLLNMLVFRLLADPGGMVFSNFSYTLYGVVAGGKGWMQILIDHPELAKLDDVARSARTYQLVFETWKAHPFDLWVGAVKNWFDYLMPRGAGAFGFIRDNGTLWTSYSVRTLLSLLAGWGLITTWKRRKSEPYGLMLWAAGGIFLSIPFVPPNDSNQMRVYAATVVFLVAFCTIGLSSLTGDLKKGSQKSFVPNNAHSHSLIFGVLLILFTLIGSIATQMIVRPKPLPAPKTCPVGQTPFILNFTSGSQVHVSDAGFRNIRGMLNVPEVLFSTIYEGYPDMHKSLVSVVNGEAVLTRTLDLLTLSNPIFLFPTQISPQESGVVSVCAQPSTDPELVMRGYWIVISATSFGEMIQHNSNCFEKGN
ncbi:MAG: hypothetical protein NTZ74_04510 [Chloroflexi bacterium]|nr:hypothetical protein [Chloroflexota bacterium]